MSAPRRHTTVRIQMGTKRLLQSLAAAEKRPMQAILHSALERYRRERFLGEVNAAYSELRNDEGKWLDWKAERSDWEVTLGDGFRGGSLTPDAAYGVTGQNRKKKKNRQRR